MYIGNLIVLTPSENNNFSHFSTGYSKHKETLGPYHYTSNQLITMSNKLKDSEYCILPFNTINKIGELGLTSAKQENTTADTYMSQKR